ncbi:MAG: hypothetical protein JO250_04920 [Armatimonadetes bacterium]|nr:hypothetical protein [Armatimonadota bacterium]
MRYNSPMTPGDSLRDFFLKGGIPVTLTLLGLNVLTFLAAFLSPQVALPFLATEMVFDSANALHAPWTFLTYPLVSVGFSLWLIITLVFFWLSGGSLERSWGSGRFAAFFFAVTAVSAASLFLGGILLHQQIPPLNDLFLPLTALIVAFCMINPNETLTFYFFPIQARWVALIVTAWVYFQYGTMLGSVLGLFACGGILAAFLYVRFGRSWADIGSYAGPRRAPRGPDLRVYPAARPSSRTTLDGSRRRSPFDLAGRWKDWQERRRLEKLLRNSGFSDSEPRWRDDEERRRR